MSLDSSSIVGELVDEAMLAPSVGWHAAQFTTKKLNEEEEKEASFVTASKVLPLSEALRLKYFMCERPLERRFFIKYFRDVSDRAIHCKGCWASEQRKTAIAFRTSMPLFTTATCMNPMGHIFHLVLIPDTEAGASQTQNLVVVGPPYVEHSWFPGYTWSFALCMHCGGHVGWRFLPRGSSTNRPAIWGIRSTEFMNSAETLRYFE
jgi:cereblon